MLERLNQTPGAHRAPPRPGDSRGRAGAHRGHLGVPPGCLRAAGCALGVHPASAASRSRVPRCSVARAAAGHRGALRRYGSGEAFARAFRAMHGVGPGEARRTGAALVPSPG
ncbi:hypothetical protein LT493_11050 [Streptomyces tricolor]|nr:hypothetical protein [Streptomyces tricolor]